MGFSSAQRNILLCLSVLHLLGFPGRAHRVSARRSERLSPPLDIQLETVNCTAVGVHWRMPRRHVSSITGYKVFYTEMRNNRPLTAPVTLDVPLSMDVLTAGHFDGHPNFDVVIGDLRVGTHYRVSVGAYGWVGEGRPSMPRDVSTAPQDTCMPPLPPVQLHVIAMSDMELALSWKPGESEGSAPISHYLVAYFRPELDTEWTHIKDPVLSTSMVLKGMLPDTEYQFAIWAINHYGVSAPSDISDPVRTFGALELGSGSYDVTSSRLDDEYGIDTDDSDYSVFVEEFNKVATQDRERNSQLRSRGGVPAPNIEENVIYRKAALGTTPDTSSNPIIPNSTMSLQISPSSPHTPVPNSTLATPLVSDSMPTNLAPPSRATSLPDMDLPLLVPVRQGEGPSSHLRDLPCEDTACPPDSFCINDYDSGGSRCHCSLGHRGEMCSEGVSIQFPKFYGYSHMTFEPLKNSYQSFQITLEFKAEAEDGLLFYCGENEHGRGDFASLAIVRRRLQYRFNCGTGSAQIVSESPVALGRWHSVTVYRDGLSGWLRLDNDAPVTGRSQGQFTKITFRTPFFLGGAPSAYWLVRVTGTNRGFQGCLQSLLINGKALDLRPWPLGHALSGADVGECSESVCEGVTCANGGVCFANQADAYICLCPLGYRGALCQESFLLSLPLFNETLMSYVSTPWPLSPQHYLSFTEFEVTFHPLASDGTLLYSEDEGSGDFLSISLVGGHIEFRFDCGSGATVIRSQQPVMLGVWHELRVSRTARNGILQVDDQMTTHGMAEGGFTQIRCSSPLYVGGVPNYRTTKHGAGTLHPFSGSIQKVVLNDQNILLTEGQAAGVNVENAQHPCTGAPCANGGTCRPVHDTYECDCPLGYEGAHCQRECGNYCLNVVADAVEIPQFIGRSYLVYDNKDILKRLSGSRTSLFLRFRSTAKDGLLLWRGDGVTRPGSDFLSLGLQDGALVFSYNLGSGVATVMVNGTFGDGLWHQVKASRDGQYGKLTVDDYGARTVKSPGKMRQLNVSGVLYVGGMREIALYTNRQFMRGLVGCISHLSLSSDYHLSLVEDATDGKNINTCGN